MDNDGHAAATEDVSVEQHFTQVRVFARSLAELVAPPTMRHQRSVTAIAIS
jgi:hypothetical protein